jgi:uncharacterized membrane protein YqjE
MTQSREEKSLGELFSTLTSDTCKLVRQEVQLAKTELLEKVALVGQSAAFIVCASLMGILALQALMAAAILGLANVVSAWLAALIVGGALLLVAGILAWLAILRVKSQGVAPRQTIESLQEERSGQRRIFHECWPSG